MPRLLPKFQKGDPKFSQGCGTECYERLLVKQGILISWVDPLE